MSNDQALIAAQNGGLLAAFQGPENPFTQYANEKGVSNDGFLRFNGNTGQYSVNGQVVEHGTVMAFNLIEAMQGWMGWSNNKPVHTILVPILSRERPPTIDKLPPLPASGKETDGWREVVRIAVRDTEGGPQLDFTLPSGESWRPVNRLLKDYGEKVKMNVDADGQFKVPLVELGGREFDGKGGKKWSPTFKIVDWMTQNELADLAAAYDANADGAAPSSPAIGNGGQAGAPMAVTQQPVPQTAAAPQPVMQQQQPVMPQQAPGPVTYRKGRVGQRM